MTRPDPNSTLESEPSPVRVRHLSGAGHNDLTAPFSQPSQFKVLLLLLKHETAGKVLKTNGSTSAENSAESPLKKSLFPKFYTCSTVSKASYTTTRLTGAVTNSVAESKWPFGLKLQTTRAIYTIQLNRKFQGLREGPTRRSREWKQKRWAGGEVRESDLQPGGRKTVEKCEWTKNKGFHVEKQHNNPPS